ncbi:MAG: hypothetical protein ACP5NS_00125 [Candidatus Pacearchaeota archaeon]
MGRIIDYFLNHSSIGEKLVGGAIVLALAFGGHGIYKENIEKRQISERANKDLARKVRDSVSGDDAVIDGREYDYLIRRIGLATKVPQRVVYGNDSGIYIETENGPVRITPEQARDCLNK